MCTLVDVQAALWTRVGYSYVESSESVRARAAVAESGCVSFDAERAHSGDVDNVENHNAQVSKLLCMLGATGAGRRAVIDAIAKVQGIDDGSELEKLYDGTSTVKLQVPSALRGTLTDIGLGNLLQPINPVTVTATAEILVANDAWKDMEFEVALDSSSVVHVCSVDDISGYRVVESPGSRNGQAFQMGDGGTIPNL